MTIAVSACTLAAVSAIDTSHVRPITEKWIIQNILYMLLGIETELFTIHSPSNIVTVNSYELSEMQCLHLSQSACRNILKRFAKFGSKVTKLRRMRRKSTTMESEIVMILESFIVDHAVPILSRLSETIEYQLYKPDFYSLISLIGKLRSHTKEVSDLFDFHVAISHAFVGNGSREGWEKYLTSRWCTDEVNGNYLSRLHEYLSDQITQFTLTGCVDGEIDVYLHIISEIPKFENLKILLNDLKYLLQHGFSESWIRRRGVAAVGPHDGGPHHHHHIRLIEGFEETTKFSLYCRAINEIIFLKRIDFLENFLQLESVDDSLANLQFHFETALTSTPGLAEFSPLFPFFTTQVKEKGGLSKFEKIRFRFNTTTSNGVFEFETLKRINGIHKQIFRIRSLTFFLNRFWAHFKILGDDVVAYAQTLRAKLSVKLQIITHAIMYDILTVRWTEQISKSSSSICESVSRYNEYLQIVEEEMNSIISKNLEILDITDRFLKNQNPNLNFCKSLLLSIR